MNGESELRTPVALSVFNRPDTTELVFGAIARAKPAQLFIFSDGPRTDDEAGACAQARKLAENVTWKCDVLYNHADHNMGARRRYASGVDWVFEHVDEAIIFDDDCLPDASFFPFCQQMLERYRNDPSVMMVCGTNYLERWKDDIQSYHFSLYGTVWGWATWKRAWSYYDVEMRAWGQEDVKQRVRDVLADEEQFEVQRRRFDRLYHDPTDRHSWDLPWSLARLEQGGLTVVPSVNLVCNLGNAAGRGLPPEHPNANIPVRAMTFPLRSPGPVVADRQYDRLHVLRIFEWWNRRNTGNQEFRHRARAFSRRVSRAIRDRSAHARSRTSLQ